MLLVDSEDPVQSVSPWEHLLARDSWTRPNGAADEDCHLMVQCMEHWLVADRAALSEYFGQDFQSAQLPAEGRPIEDIRKTDLLRALANASKHCKTKESYSKSKHSFDLLERIDPNKVMTASPWACRLVVQLKLATTP